MKYWKSLKKYGTYIIIKCYKLFILKVIFWFFDFAWNAYPTYYKLYDCTFVTGPECYGSIVSDTALKHWQNICDDLLCCTGCICASTVTIIVYKCISINNQWVRAMIFGVSCDIVCKIHDITAHKVRCAICRYCYWLEWYSDKTPGPENSVPCKPLCLGLFHRNNNVDNHFL